VGLGGRGVRVGSGGPLVACVGGVLGMVVVGVLCVEGGQFAGRLPRICLYDFPSRGLLSGCHASRSTSETK
jgi:hypothetical protein